jgi:hypothetical protein
MQRNKKYIKKLGRLEWKIPIRRPRRRWEDNIKIDLMERVWTMSIGLIWLRIVTGG